MLASRKHSSMRPSCGLYIASRPASSFARPRNLSAFRQQVPPRGRLPEDCTREGAGCDGLAHSLLGRRQSASPQYSRSRLAPATCMARSLLAGCGCERGILIAGSYELPRGSGAPDVELSTRESTDPVPGRSNLDGPGRQHEALTRRPHSPENIWGHTMSFRSALRHFSRAPTVRPAARLMFTERC
jgi:hypothetical protein